ncbi:molybdopterin molybdotransferase (plasmid) [Ketogulonicigenium robustum]|uniref:Molybdopterin molybdenumtransferase n=1 Tax=Ketogulonicigenium robustum TaxID=92947 RepID=A0A1W6P344_9RHOB|nr:molybdopterin molybdotransferase MoeA [Ketogulonicigenium robustum]ARO15922.1 molybdopterin molybdotransferase [Ketogulonicigenium robustum]
MSPLPRPSVSRFADCDSDQVRRVDWVLDALDAQIAPIDGVEFRAPDHARGRVLARAIAALRHHPIADNAAVDGYALGGPPTESSYTIRPGSIAAGDHPTHPVGAGLALRIMTGATLPPDTYAVVPDEVCSRAGPALHIARPPRAGENMRLQGEDIRQGAPLLPAGRRLRATDLALLAAAGWGHAPLPLRPKLRVALASTGRELAATADRRVIDSNRPMLRALLEQQGYDVVDLGLLPDDEGSLRAALDAAASQADAIVTSGGASRGDHDVVARLLLRDSPVLNWRVAMKPGRPLMLTHWKGLPVFGLPGNPVAAYTCAIIFALPALAKRAGGAFTRPTAYTLPAAFSHSKPAGRREYLRARLRPDGALDVFKPHGSNRISGLAYADGLIDLPEDVTTVAPGDSLRYIPLAPWDY